MTTHLDNTGIPRQAHYGDGRQPWDDILEAGWAPEFAAGNILKYLRRTKAPEHSLESARWYADRSVRNVPWYFVANGMREGFCSATTYWSRVRYDCTVEGNVD